MNASTQIAKHFRDAYFGGNWTTVDLKEQLFLQESTLNY